MTSAGENPHLAKKSAMMVGTVLLLIASWNFYQQRPAVYVTLGLCGVALVLTGLFSAAGAQKFYAAWMRFAGALGYINSRILLSLMFYGVITPYGVVMRMFRRDTMNRRSPAQESYWIPRKKTRQAREQYERLF